MKMNRSILKLIALISLFTFLAGCTATHTAIRKRNLDVQTKMSATIFLDPVADHKKTIFVQVKNSTDKPAFDIQHQVKTAIINKGYKIVNDPDNAQYILQANILSVGQMDLRAAEHALNGGYGAALSGALIGGGVGALSSTHSDGLLIGALVGGAISTITDAMVKDVSFSAITDIQVSERVSGKVMVREKTHSKLSQGTSGTKEITSNERINWKKYQTRIISTANKVNLKFEKAQKPLIAGLAKSIAGIF